MLRKINTFVDAITIGRAIPGNKKDKDKVFALETTGYLVGAKYEIGKEVKGGKIVRKGNTIWQFQNKKRETFEVWGNASINGALSSSNGRINPEFANCLVVIKFVSMRDSGKGKNEQRVCDVLVDDTDKLKTK